MPPHCGVQDVFLPLKESRSCLIAVEIIELLAFDYCYDCGLYKTRKTFVYQKKP